MAASVTENDHSRTTAESTTTVLAAAPRPFGALLVLAGLVHVLAPGVLLQAARLGYEQILDVRFRPRDTATGRVRAIGLGMLAAGLHLLYHGGIRPNRNQ